MAGDMVGLYWLNWSGETGLIVAAEVAHRFSAIEVALEEAKTWREFERLSPKGEFESLSLWWCNGGENIYEIDGQYRFIDAVDLEEFWQVCGPDYVIAADKPFDSFSVPGVSDCVYPAWASNTAEDILPDEFVRRFGKVNGSPGAGAWTEYRQEDREEIEEYLADHGFSL